ncbi:MAG: AraC family transcriptional regulator ligand-binding domain-containing protein [Rhodanobacteraceae bacterium]|nr:AraC family transcriptional regulator ligand-binding domain-containing protein [Rhodanobacteraceae bacterium]
MGEVSAGLPTTVFGDTDRLPLAPARALIAAAMTATATPWLGLELGAAAQAHTHGLVGTAAFASSTLGEALQTVARFAPLRTQALQFHWQATPSGGELVINARARTRRGARLRLRRDAGDHRARPAVAIGYVDGGGWLSVARAEASLG